MFPKKKQNLSNLSLGKWLFFDEHKRGKEIFDRQTVYLSFQQILTEKKSVICVLYLPYPEMQIKQSGWIFSKME
jgi:hypothetical protein